MYDIREVCWIGQIPLHCRGKRRNSKSYDPILSDSGTTLVARDSSVGTATAYGLDGPGIESRWGARFSAPVQIGPEGHPASCTMGTGSLLRVKQPGRDVDPSPLLVQRTKIEQSYTCTLPKGLRGL